MKKKTKRRAARRVRAPLFSQRIAPTNHEVSAKRGSATHREPADAHAATELVLYIENTSDLSPDGPSGQGRSVLLNALRKWRKGTYDPALGIRLFEYLAESGAKRYAKEFSVGNDWATTFTPATRHEAAKQLEASFRNSAEQGEYDHVDTKIGAHEVNAPRGGSMDAFTRAYIEAALWSSNDESDDSGGEPLDKNYDISDITPETRDRMIADCADFQERFADLLSDSGIANSRAGFCFWLSRNGHGSGFFDEDTIEEKFQNKLQDAAKEYGETYLYVGDDGQIHGHEETRKRGVQARGGVRAPAGRGHHVRDYEAVDNRDRHIAGPFKSYGDARAAAGTAGVVKFVPSRGKTGRATEVRASRSAHHPIGRARPR